MITERDAEAGRGQRYRENAENEPINTEMPEIRRHRRQRQDKCADQERAGRPVNSIKWNSKLHLRILNFLTAQPDNGRPRTTSSFVQLWTEPQCAQVNFCFFIFAVGQRFSSTVWPVSVSLDVDGHRTSKLFQFAPGLFFGRRGGSKRNRVAIN